MVDGGRRGDALPSLLARMAVPEDWRILLVQDHAHQGLSGATEVEAFARLPPLPEHLTARICRLVLMGLLPAVSEGDIAFFGEAVTEIQAIAAEHNFELNEPARRLSRQQSNVAGLIMFGKTPGSYSPDLFMLEHARIDATFARRFIAALAAHGGASVGLLRVDGRPIAAQVLLYSGNMAYTWKTAFDAARTGALTTSEIRC